MKPTRRVKPWGTGELAKTLGVSQRTAIRMVDDNVFGAEGHEWFRTPGGVRRVKNSAVQSYLKRIS